MLRFISSRRICFLCGDIAGKFPWLIPQLVTHLNRRQCHTHEHYGFSSNCLIYHTYYSSSKFKHYEKSIMLGSTPRAFANFLMVEKRGLYFPFSNRLTVSTVNPAFSANSRWVINFFSLNSFHFIPLFYHIVIPISILRLDKH